MVGYIEIPETWDEWNAGVKPRRKRKIKKRREKLPPPNLNPLRTRHRWKYPWRYSTIRERYERLIRLKVAHEKVCCAAMSANDPIVERWFDSLWIMD